MKDHDFIKLSRKALLVAFEEERLQWLAAGMYEAQVFRIHFGEDEDEGKGGDYGVWLSERKHLRPDHKYAPGIPISMDSISHANDWLVGRSDEIAHVDFSVDLELALATLTEIQRRYFVLVRMEGFSFAEVARLEEKVESTVFRTVKAAEKKLKKFFS